jgi:exonuclease SbcD
MRIVHTGDWHVGRLWKNLNRLDEMQAVLDHLAGFLESERIDLLLVAGDLFETFSPSADAERVVFQFFRRVGAAGIPSVVVAGNHDHPTRIDAWGTLAQLAGVRAVGRARSAKDGGLLEVSTAHGLARVACLPFAPARVWAQVLENAGETLDENHSYPSLFRQAVRHLCRGFGPDSVNLVVAHTHVQGAVVGSTERPLHVAPEWAVLPSDFPGQAQYVALGHVHRPQTIIGSPVETRFCGSALQLDFGEAGDDKSFVLIDAEPGQPVRTTLVGYQGGQPLADVRLTLRAIAAEQLHLRSSGWLKVTVPLEHPDADLARKVRSQLPNAIVVHADLPETPRLIAVRPPVGANVRDYYRAYLKVNRGQEEPPAALLDTFTTLYESARGDGDASGTPVA